MVVVIDGEGRLVAAASPGELAAVLVTVPVRARARPGSSGPPASP